jgi:hypothetical protein
MEQNCSLGRKWWKWNILRPMERKILNYLTRQSRKENKAEAGKMEFLLPKWKYLSAMEFQSTRINKKIIVKAGVQPPAEPSEVGGRAVRDSLLLH